MKNRVKRIFILLGMLAACTGIFSLPVAADYSDTIQADYSEAYYLVSLNEDATVICEKNSNVRTAPASLTKVMTAIVTLENCSDLDGAMLTASSEAIHALDGTDSSIIDLKVGDTYSLRKLLEGMLVLSGNDAANVIAEYVGNQKDGGGIPTFINMMNEKAQELGCADTHFVSPHGLDAEGHYSTAQDLAKMTRYALETFPVFGQIVSMQSYTLPNGKATLPNTNYMLVPAYYSYYNERVTGVKTGTTDDAGHCVIATAKSGGYNYLAVVLRSQYVDTDGDGIQENGAFLDANKLLNWAIDNLKLKTVAGTQEVVTEVPLLYSGKSDYLQLVPEQDVTALVPGQEGADAPSVMIEPIADTLPENVKAPVEQGDVICQARVLYANEEIATVNLVAAQSYSLSPFAFVGHWLSTAFHSVIFKIIAAVVVVLIIAYILLVIRYNRIRRRRRVRLVKGQNASGEYRAAPKTSIPGGRPLKRGKRRTPPRR